MGCLLLVSACGANPLCERLQSSSNRFFAGVSSMEGQVCVDPMAPRVTVTPWGFNYGVNSTCSQALGRCSAKDEASLVSYIECLERLPPCDEGKEKAAVEAVQACVKTLKMAAVSPECAVALE